MGFCTQAHMGRDIVPVQHKQSFRLNAYSQQIFNLALCVNKVSQICITFYESKAFSSAMQITRVLSVS